MPHRSIAVISLIFSLAFPLRHGLAQNSAREEVLRVEAAFTEAKLHNDVGALDRIVADDYVGINQSGERRDKNGLLHTRFGVTSLDSTNVTVHVNGDTATVDGRTSQSGGPAYLFVRTYVKRGGKWLLLASAQALPVDQQSMRVVALPAPAPVHPITGRQYAGTMGIGGADWLVRPEREKEEEPDVAIAALKIAKGSTVADIGAGVGYFSWRLAEVVGPAGKVYANDIQAEMLSRLKKNMQDRGITNVVTVLGKADDPGLPKGAVDLALMVDVYHEFSEPQKMLDRIHEALKPDGRLVLLEYRKEDPKVQIKPLHKMSVAEVKAEIEPEGYKLEQVLEILPIQHIIIFRAR